MAANQIAERIRARRKELGLRADEVADKIGVSRATIYRYESNEIEKFPTSTLEPIAEALQTTPAYLMGWSDDPGAPADALPENLIPLPAMRRIPLLGTIACGEPLLAVENFEGDVDIPQYVHADFALRCKGDSMINARIFDGDIVYIRQQPDVENGEIAAVLIGDEATLKRVYKTAGQVTLMPENSAYPPLVYTGAQLEEVRILGKALAFTSMVK